MKYSEIRDQIKTGDVFSCCGKRSWFSKAITIFQGGSEITHSALAIWTDFPGVENGRLCIYESMEPGGVRLTPLSIALESYAKEGGHIYWQPLIDSNINNRLVVQYALQQWTKAYASIYQIALIVSPWLRLLRKLRGGNWDTDKNRFICSELVISSLAAGGYDHQKEKAFTTPDEVSNLRCLGPKILIEV